MEYDLGDLSTLEDRFILPGARFRCFSSFHMDAFMQRNRTLRNKALRGVGWALQPVLIAILLWFYIEVVIVLLAPCARSTLEADAILSFCPSASLSRILLVVVHVLAVFVGWSWWSLMTKEPGMDSLNHFHWYFVDFHLTRICAVTLGRRRLLNWHRVSRMQYCAAASFAPLQYLWQVCRTARSP